MKGFSKIVAIIVVAAIVLGSISSIFIFKKSHQSTPSPNELPSSTTPSTPSGQTTPTNEIPVTQTEPTFSLKKDFVSAQEVPQEQIDIKPQALQYPLPLDLKSIVNLGTVSGKITLNDKDKALLSQNGFAVFDTPEEIASQEFALSYSNGVPVSTKDDYTAYYVALQGKDIPIFITADSVLHYYHIIFDTTLMTIERDVFYDYVWDITKYLFDESLKEYNATSEDLKEASRRNVAYFSVALTLLTPNESQIITDEKLKEMYCKGLSDEECKYAIENAKMSAQKIYFTEEQAVKYKFAVPDFVKDDVANEIKLIEAHKGWEYSPIFIYKEDYSQYVPRGHYNNSEKLKNYFKALMWYGRMTMLVNGSKELDKGESICGGPDGIISDYDATMQTLQALLTSYNFMRSPDVQDKWSRMYEVTSFLIGFSDDLGPYEYAKVLNDAFGHDASPKNIQDNITKIEETLKALPYNPKIYSGLGECELVMPCPPLTDEDIQKLKVQAKELLNETKGFRLLGQKFTIDSWIFSEIVSPYSGEYTGEKTPLPTNELPLTYTWNDQYPADKENRPFTWVKTLVDGCGDGREVRGFPRGLDIMAVLGSDRAYDILKDSDDTNYSDYDKKFTEIKKEIDALPQSEWYKNVYMNWLYTLKSLFTSFGKGYPTFMQSKAWADKELNTALSSWTELRHDTILYVKQSYTMAEKGEGEPEGEKPFPGYVEPVPEFYSRLLTLTKLTGDGLKKLLPQEDFQNLSAFWQFDSLSWVPQRLLEISKKEIENKPFDDTDYYTIKGIGDSFDRSMRDLFMGNVDLDFLKSSLVSDVHTEGNTKLVLEEATGYIKTMVVACKTPDGKIHLAVGPVFSYYEFKQPMDSRLTDQEWRKMLEGAHPNTPEWVSSFAH
jgi:hypothetical protein